MAKRTRGSNRPGQRQSARTQSQPANRPSGSLSRDEEARAADLESQIVARERVADVERARTRGDAAQAQPIPDAGAPHLTGDALALWREVPLRSGATTNVGTVNACTGICSAGGALAETAPENYKTTNRFTFRAPCTCPLSP